MLATLENSNSEAQYLTISSECNNVKILNGSDMRRSTKIQRNLDLKKYSEKDNFSGFFSLVSDYEDLLNLSMETIEYMQQSFYLEQ